MSTIITSHFSYILVASMHGSNSADHITNMIVSSIIHGLIYHVIFRSLNSLPLPVSIAIAIVCLAGIWLYFKRKY